MRKWTRALPMAALLSMSVGAQAVGRLPVDVFSREFTYDTVEISPDGSKIAVAYHHEDMTILAVLELDTTSKAVFVGGVKAPDILGSISWKTGERLIYRSYHQDAYFNSVPILTAVNTDASNRVLLNYNPQRNGRYTTDSLVDLNWTDPTTAYIVSETARADFPVVYRVNVERGTPLSISIPVNDVEWPTVRRPLFSVPGRECSYRTDTQGVVRTCLTIETDNSVRLLYRADEGGEWVELARFGADGPRIVPLGFTPDGKQMYVSSNVGRDNRALFLYDPERKALGELLFDPSPVDLGAAIYGGDHRTLVAVTYYKKDLGAYYLDAGLGAMHRALNKAFPGRQVRPLSFSRDNARAVVWAGDASTPGTYYLFDRKRTEARKIADIAPWMQSSDMATMRAIAFDARDGVRLSGYLTMPRGAGEKNLPLIVNVHGGPFGVRDYEVFDRETQLFANRGYAVLQVNFRGSGGYGHDFRSAGYREWGGKMQTDLEDGVRWLVRQGTVDVNRVGIFGVSYGGYAAMMALVTAPDLYKCAVTYSGVSNLVHTLHARKVVARSGLYRTISKQERLFWESVIGDRDDEAALKEISPLFNVDKVRAPVLIVHGDEDLVVPLSEATDLERALRRAGKQVDMLIVRREGHGFHREKSREALYRKMDDFLGRYLPAEAHTSSPSTRDIRPSQALSRLSLAPTSR